MASRRLPAFVLPLGRGPWMHLRFDGQDWVLVARAEPQNEQRLAGIRVVWENQRVRWVRLRWAGSGWRRWWPHERHLCLRQSVHSANWTLIGAALARHGGREWLGRR